VREKIERYELTRTIDPAHFFRTLDEAVAEYVRQTGATCGVPGRRRDHHVVRVRHSSLTGEVQQQRTAPRVLKREPALKAVMQDDGSLPRPGCAVRLQPVIPAKLRRKLCDLGFPAEQNFLDEFQSGVPGLGLAGVVEAGKLDEVVDGLGAGGVVDRLDGERRVAVEDDLSAGQMAGEPVQ